MIFIRKLMATAIALVATPALAVPFSPMDGRSFSMGGTGVANAKAASASLFNPAMLAAQKQTADFSIILPTVGVIADDSEGVMDVLDNMQGDNGSLDRFEQAIDAYNAAPGLGTASAVGGATVMLVDDLDKLNKKPVTVDVGTGFGFGIPSKALGFGLHVTGTASLGIVTDMDGAELATIRQLGTDLSNGAPNCGAGYIEPGTVCDLKSPEDLMTNSSLEAVGIGITEVGVSLAHEFDFAGNTLALGITPKMVKIYSIQYKQSLGQDSEIDEQVKEAKYRNEFTDVNLDIGVAKTFGDVDSALVAGLVIRNIIPKTYKTAGLDANLAPIPSYEIELSPQVRAGIAKRWNRFNVAADLDLTKNKGTGLNGESQFLAVGGEMDFRFIQLRAGYRMNLASNGVQDMVTAGIGLGPLDISAMYADEHSAGVNVQLGFSF